mgnify:CR=1 FL=1
MHALFRVWAASVFEKRLFCCIIWLVFSLAAPPGLPEPMKLLRDFPLCRIPLPFQHLPFFTCFLHSECYNMKLRSASGQT